VFTHRGESAGKYLEKAGLTAYFSDVVTWDDRFTRKPDPSGNLSIIEKHGLRPASLLAVGDREIDMLAGKAAGTDACLFRATDMATVADYKIKELGELYPILGLNS
jgi:phosphoglycolate phosphatase-like HAD superfamily hydrolase